MVIETIDRISQEGAAFQTLSSYYAGEWDDVVSERVYGALSALASEISSLASSLENEKHLLISIEQSLSALAYK